MAPAIDTIVVLNNLAFAQNAAAAALIDIDDTTAEAVKTYAVHVPVSVKQCRVVFDNSLSIKDKAIRVRLTKVTNMTDLTKTENTESLAWTLLPAGAQDGTEITETGTIDISASWASTLHIDCAMAEDGIGDGLKILVQIASEAGVNDSWTDLTRFNGPTGTAISQAVNGDNASGQKVIGLANPVTSNFDNDGKFKFIKNTTIANSEIIYQTCHGADA